MSLLGALTFYTLHSNLFSILKKHRRVYDNIVMDFVAHLPWLVRGHDV